MDFRSSSCRFPTIHPSLKILELDEQWKKRLSPPSVDMKLLKFVFLGASRAVSKVWDPVGEKNEWTSWTPNLATINLTLIVNFVNFQNLVNLVNLVNFNWPPGTWTWQWNTAHLFWRPSSQRTGDFNPVQASRRSRWSPNLRSHPSFSHRCEVPKWTHPPPKKGVLELVFGIDCVFFW